MEVRKVSIGLPVYNGSSTVSRAIESILSQSYRNFELVISDNASTDGTEAICAEYAKQDERIRYQRHPKGIGAVNNFRWVLSHSRGDYFIWVADDDWRSDNFLEACVAILDTEPACVAATSYDYDELTGSIRTFELRGNRSERMTEFLDNAFHSNALFYSLIRMEVIRKFRFENTTCLANDWLIIAFLASQGEIRRAPEAMTHIAPGGLSQSDIRYSTFRTRNLHWFYPLYEFSAYVTRLAKDLDPNTCYLIRLKLLEMNYLVALDSVHVELSRNESAQKSRFLDYLNQSLIYKTRLYHLLYRVVPDIFWAFGRKTHDFRTKNHT